MVALVSGFFSYLVYFITIWVGVFFMCLPLFHPEPPKKIGKGHATSGPANPQVGKKILLSFAITALLLVIIITLQHFHILPTLEDFDK
ncbi:MAG: DUF1467 family protein [Hydrotalea sp.]|nr:DUF1467 family protein [Hydrotalea sp.]